jgi:hypothetical protein
MLQPSSHLAVKLGAASDRTVPVNFDRSMNDLTAHQSLPFLDHCQSVYILLRFIFQEVANIQIEAQNVR